MEGGGLEKDWIVSYGACILFLALSAFGKSVPFSLASFPHH